MPRRTGEPERAVTLDARDRFAGRLVVPLEPDEDLVEDDVVQDLDARVGAENGLELLRASAEPVDEVFDAMAPEGAERGVDRDAAAAARELGIPIDLIALDP